MADSSQKRIAVLVVAAGMGARAGGEIPKQYRQLGGVAVLRHSLSAFLQHPCITHVAVVIQPEQQAHYLAACKGLALLPAITGGATRQQSVLNGLEGLATLAPDHVLIHDAARPFVSAALINRVLHSLDEGAAAVVPALPVSDTVKRIAAGKVAETLAREHLAAAQTPQGFIFKTILDLHRAHRDSSVTDDAALAERARIPVIVVEGDPANTKLTTPHEMEQASLQFLSSHMLPEIRVGQGYDVHRFVPLTETAPSVQPHIMLCGIAVPHSQTLEGHSDADAGLHALTDALLGAVAGGDIGMHFTPGDPRWKGAESSQFLADARDRIVARGGRILHVDVTLICEEPKVGPHRDAMRMRIASILSIDRSRVSVKATTTEGLGFTGRKEGIAAQAVATVELSPIIEAQT